MLKAIPFLVVLATASFGQNAANDEAQVWNLEKAYWEYEFTPGKDTLLPFYCHA